MINLRKYFLCLYSNYLKTGLSRYLVGKPFCHWAQSQLTQMSSLSGIKIQWPEYQAKLYVCLYANRSSGSRDQVFKVLGPQLNELKNQTIDIILQCIFLIGQKLSASTSARFFRIYQRNRSLQPQIYTNNMVYILNIKDPTSFLIRYISSLQPICTGTQTLKQMTYQCATVLPSFTQVIIISAY